MRRAALCALLALMLTACSGDTATTPAHTAAPARAAPRPPSATAELPLLEAELPRADRVDLARRLKRYTGPAAAPAPPRDEQRGTWREFWVVQSDPPRAFTVGATLRAASTHAAFYVQDGTDVSDADMDRAARQFETAVYPAVTRLFGEPRPPAGGDPRITILHLNLPGVGGYFTDTDQLPRAIVPMSNERRMIYIDLRAGPPGTDAYVGVVAHEFQHLVHHDANPSADSWLNEGLSELAAEAAGDGGGFLRAYQNAPGTQLNDWAVSGSNSAHYGAAHSFLRYLLRHYGGLERARDLVAQGGSGVNAVQQYLRAGNFGVGFEDVFADWLVAGYLALPGDGRFSNPGLDSQVRSVTRLADPQDGRGSVRQFGADFFEIDTRGKDAVFHFRGATTVKQVPNEPASGRGEWWSNRADSLDATLTRELDLRAVAAATLRFKAWFDIERGYDYAYVTVSTDGGATWTALRGRQASDFDPLGQALGPGYTGVSGGGEAAGWTDEQVDLTPYAGRAVLVRFEYVTDEAAAGPGFAVDDIAVPEIGFFDDAEQDSGWQASGFHRLTGPVPQRYLLQVITEEPGGWTARRVEAAADGTADIRLRGSDKRAAVIVSGATYGTNLAGAYEWRFERAGG